jgi:hypothetical protein
MNNFDYISQQQNKIHRLNNPVLDVFVALREYAEEFERGLDADQEVGARLVSFGSEITLHVRQIGYSKPNIITFDGVLENGTRVKLVQHVSQLSVLFVAVPVKPESPKRPIGFTSG